jgi:hypothetical protein
MLLAERGAHESQSRRTQETNLHVRARCHCILPIAPRDVEEADETCYWLDLIRGAKITSDPALERLLGEAGELTALFSQSQLTAKGNAAAHATPRTRHRSSETNDP